MPNTMIARRSSYNEHSDDFPTPPWATRALFSYIMPDDELGYVWEPACGAGYMARAILEYTDDVKATDIRGNPPVDFLTPDNGPYFDWVITNPPYKLAEAFFHRAVEVAGNVALLVRINWLQNGGRYERIFKPYPPAIIAIFAARMPAAQGKVIRKESMYFQHCWAVWKKNNRKTQLVWIPPEAQHELEREEDYT